MSALRRRTILVVDDEPAIASSLRLLLQSHFDVLVAGTAADTFELVAKHPIDAMLLDVGLPDADGVEVLQQLRASNYSAPVIMLTGDNSAGTAVEAMKRGASDYVSKPFNIDALTNTLWRLFEDCAEVSVREVKRSETSAPTSLIGSSPVMLALGEQIKKIASHQTTVLVTGESGTGKELVAREIHRLSSRSKQPFIAINCGAIPESLVESELFGHEKGSFTHAVETRLGYFEQADGGTIFLDEIGELTLAVQVKLLRFLQEQEFFRVGRSKPIKVDVRVIAATNRDLEEMVAAKQFRQDLFYRVHVVNLETPRLADRMGDIPKLLKHFQEQFAKRYGNRTLEFSTEALSAIESYGWPGNVRELENLTEQLLALAPDDVVNLVDLPPAIARSQQDMNVIKEVFQGSLNYQDAERRFETEIIVKALEKTNYVQTKAAELLGISRRILKYKMDKLGIAER
jgi:two-component system, NtrC family, response regulator AtoC